ncbi:MAG TPA: hypothetical protein VFR85_11025 [Anaeromyxobacteraceae bacterium]|nr:hypothetical protein [Anaeromyxobacteraceae bacterium]
MTPMGLAREIGSLAPRRGADPEFVVDELSRQLAEASARLAVAPDREAPGVEGLLAAALREKVETSEVAALWMAGEFDLELKLAFARLCGDQARHYRLLADRLQALDPSAARIDPLARGHSPLFRFLRSLETPAERLAAGLLGRQGVARIRGAILADLCLRRGDEETARLQGEVIGPEEADHRDMGRRLLVRFALTPEDQERARRALARALQFSEERREPARGKPARGSGG